MTFVRYGFAAYENFHRREVCREVQPKYAPNLVQNMSAGSAISSQNFDKYESVLPSALFSWMLLVTYCSISRIILEGFRIR